jgi:hypothetical protein
MALPSPTVRDSRTVIPPPGMMPTRPWVSANRARSEATRNVHWSATRAERRVGTREDQHTDVRVGVGGGGGVPQRVLRRPVERVAGLRPVQRHRRDVVLDDREDNGIMLSQRDTSGAPGSMEIKLS